MGYINSVNPEMLTISDLVEMSQQPNAEKVLHELKKTIFKKHIPTRQEQLREFFNFYNGNINGFEQEVQEMAFTLNISQDEWNQNRQMLDRIEIERGGRSF
jgi:uncharacterized protein YaaN involved in tellurite resistance